MEDIHIEIGVISSQAHSNGYESVIQQRLSLFWKYLLAQDIS